MSVDEIRHLLPNEHAAIAKHTTVGSPVLSCAQGWRTEYGVRTSNSLAIDLGGLAARLSSRI